MLELVLFENDAEGARRAMQAGISAFMVDLELMGKDLRQLGFDTEIRPGQWSDLEAIAAEPGARAWCRINSYGEHTPGEVENAVSAGASVVLLPMVRRADEVSAFLGLLNSRCEAAIMVETRECAEIAASLQNLPIDHVFFGLNDFAISRGNSFIFSAVADGEVEAVRRAMPERSFGFGGLTDLRRGVPIPSARLLEELERLNCSFTFLRRSFRRDAQAIGAAEIVSGIQRYWRECARRSDEERLADHAALLRVIEANR
ncbi:MAG: hypothetical protein AAGI11_10705 [Pseudomonadota bacterium]